MFLQAIGQLDLEGETFTQKQRYPREEKDPYIHLNGKSSSFEYLQVCIIKQCRYE